MCHGVEYLRYDVMIHWFCHLHIHTLWFMKEWIKFNSVILFSRFVFFLSKTTYDKIDEMHHFYQFNLN